MEFRRPPCTYCGAAEGDPCVVLRPWSPSSWEGRPYKNEQYVHEARMEAYRRVTKWRLTVEPIDYEQLTALRHQLFTLGIDSITEQLSP